MPSHADSLRSERQVRQPTGGGERRRRVNPDELWAFSPGGGQVRQCRGRVLPPILTRQSYSADEATKVLLAFLHGTAGWRTMVEWKKRKL
jgi:hypothetical protein